MIASKRKHCLQCFQVLGDETRFELIRMLREHRSNVKDLTKSLGVTQPTVSHHLKILDTIGLVAKDREGRQTMYRFNENYPCYECGMFRAPIKV